MGTEVAITNFPEPKTPTTFNLEDLPFWDSEQPIPQVEVPVSLNQAKLFDSITYKMVETAAYCAFEGHNSKYDVKNFKKHLDRNIRKLYNSILDGTYTKYIAYRKLEKYNHKGKLRSIDSPILHLRILQWLWILIIVPFYNRKDNGNGRNCKPEHGITAKESKYGILKPQKHLFYDLRYLHYVLVMDQRKCYGHITPKIYRKQIKRLTTDAKFIDIDKAPLDNCGYVTYRNPGKGTSSHNKGYTLVRTTTVDRARQCQTDESWASYFGLMIHADSFNVMNEIENNMPDLRKLTEEIRIDREIDAPTVDVKDLLGIKFTLYKYRFKSYRGKINWVQCLIGTKKWIESTAPDYDPKDPRKRARSKTNKKQLKKIPRGKNQEYAWEFHGDYQGIIAYLKELETVFNGDTSKYIPITHAEIIKDGEYIFKGSTNKQRFINTLNTEE